MNPSIENFSKDIQKKTSDLFNALSRRFSVAVFNEIVILHKTGDTYTPVYYEQYAKSDTNSEETHSRCDLSQVNFFTEYILKKWALGDGEGVFNFHGEKEYYDVMMRSGDYYIALNNSEESLQSFHEKYHFDERGVIDELQRFMAAFESR